MKNCLKALIVLLFLGWWVGTASAGIWYLPLPEGISTNAYRIDRVIHYTDRVITIFFGIVVGALIFFIIRYRSRDGHKAVYDRGDKLWHSVVTVGLGMLVFFSIDAVIEGMAFKDLKEAFWNFPKGKEVLRVEVMPQQFAWNIRYAGSDGKFATEDDLVPALNDMRVPIDTPVVVQLAPFDVIHSFYVPELRIKQDATPGMVTAFWFQAKKIGTFEIACAELCGNAHYRMKGTLTVVSKEEFASWLNVLEERRQAASSDDFWTETADASSGNVPKNWGWTWQEKEQ